MYACRTKLLTKITEMRVYCIHAPIFTGVDISLATTILFSYYVVAPSAVQKICFIVWNDIMTLCI